MHTARHDTTVDTRHLRTRLTSVVTRDTADQLTPGQEARDTAIVARDTGRDRESSDCATDERKRSADLPSRGVIVRQSADLPILDNIFHEKAVPSPSRAPLGTDTRTDETTRPSRTYNTDTQIYTAVVCCVPVRIIPGGEGRAQ